MCNKLVSYKDLTNVYKKLIRADILPFKYNITFHKLLFEGPWPLGDILYMVCILKLYASFYSEKVITFM